MTEFNNKFNNLSISQIKQILNSNNDQTYINNLHLILHVCNELIKDYPDDKTIESFSLPKACANIKKPKNNKVSIDSPEYKITLEFLNALLKAINIDHPPITHITQFTDVKRDDLLTEECKAVLDLYLDPLVKAFGKTKIQYYKRDQTESYIITILRYIVTHCGYSFLSRQKHIKKNKIDKINVATIKKNNMVYSII